MLSAIPLFIPRDIDDRDEVMAFNAIFATIGEHGLMQRSPLSVASAGAAVFGSRHDDAAPLARQNAEPLRMRSKHVSRLLKITCHETSFHVPMTASSSAGKRARYRSLTWTRRCTHVRMGPYAAGAVSAIAAESFVFDFRRALPTGLVLARRPPAPPVGLSSIQTGA